VGEAPSWVCIAAVQLPREWRIDNCTSAPTPNFYHAPVLRPASQARLSRLKLGGLQRPCNRKFKAGHMTLHIAFHMRRLTVAAGPAPIKGSESCTQQKSAMGHSWKMLLPIDSDRSDRHRDRQQGARSDHYLAVLARTWARPDAWLMVPGLALASQLPSVLTARVSGGKLASFA